MKNTHWPLFIIIFLSAFTTDKSNYNFKVKEKLQNFNSKGQKGIKKKKILFYLHNLESGGIQKSILSLLTYLDYSKYEIDLFLTQKVGAKSNFKQIPKGVNLIYLYHPFFKSNKPSENKLIEILKKAEFFFFEILMKIYKNFNWLTYNQKLKNKKYDLEISLFTRGLEFLIKSPLNSKKIAWVHMDLKNENQLPLPKEINYALKNLSKVNKIITVSYQNKESLLSEVPEIKDKIEVIYNPISAEEVMVNSLESISEKKHEFLQLVTLGRLAPQKGFDRLIEACYKLKNEDQLNFHLWIVGEGPQRAKLEDQIKSLGLENTIKLLGFRANPYPYLKAADLFVLSSYHECMPYVILEAMILNKPIVSTNVSGPGELLKASLNPGKLTTKGEYGLLSENSTEGIYQGLKQMLINKALRESFMNKNPDFSAFEPHHVIRQVEKLFDEMLS